MVERQFNFNFPHLILRNGRLHSDPVHTLISRRLRYGCVGLTLLTSEVGYFNKTILDIHLRLLDAWSDQVLASHNQARSQYGAMHL